MMGAPASPTLAELLELSVDDSDQFGWKVDDAEPFEPAGSPAAEAPAPTARVVEMPRRDHVVTVEPRRTLRDHVAAVEFIADTIERLDDSEMSDDVRDQLSKELIAELAGTRAKVDNVSRVLALFEHLEHSAVTERDRLAKRASYYERQRERLETYVLAVLSASDLPRIEGETSTLARRLCPPAVVIEDATKIPQAFMRFPEPPPPAPNKALIAKELKANRIVPGASLSQGSKLVRS